LSRLEEAVGGSSRWAEESALDDAASPGEGDVGLEALRRAASAGGPARRALDQIDAALGGGAGRWLAVGVAAVVLVAGAIVLLRPHPTAPPSAEPDLPMTSGASTVAGPSTSAASDVVVEITGAIRQPGVYHLPVGARLGDLVERAGGLAPVADSDRVDLAAPVADGALVYIPRRGETAAPGPVIGGGAPGASGAASPIDLNTATADQLDALPGVGPATASAILAYRRGHGPFSSVDQLAQVSGIGPAKLAKIRPLVHV
jgi:competence protein ComEA